MSNERLQALLAEKERRKKLQALLAEKERRSKNESPDYKRYAARAGRDIAASVGDIADIPALPFEAARYATQWVQNKMNPEVYKEAEFGKWLPGIGEKIAHGIDVATEGYTAPQTSGERMAEAVTRGLASLPVGMGAGAALSKIPGALGKTGKAFKAISQPTASNIGATAGSSAAAQGYLEGNEDPSVLAALASGIAGGTVGGAGANIAKGLVKPKDSLAGLAGKLTGFSPEEYAKNIEAGYAPSIASSSSSTIPTAIEEFMGKVPFTSKIISNLKNKREMELAKRMGLEGYEDLSEAVKNPRYHLAKKGAERFAEERSKGYQELEDIYKPSVKELSESYMPVSNLLESIQKDFLKGKSKQSYSKDTIGKIYKDIESYVPSDLKQKQKLYKEVLPYKDKIPNFETEFGNIPHEQAITLSDFDTIRDNVHTAMLGAPDGSAAKKRLTDLYTKLRDEKQNYLESSLPSEEAKAAKEARNYWAKYRKDIGEYVDELRFERNPHDAFKKLTQDPKYLEAASKYLNKQEKAQLADAMMVGMGTNQGRFNIASAYTQWSKKGITSEVRDAYRNLLPNEKAIKNFDNAMDFVRDNKHKISQIANTSGTADRAALWNTLGKGTAAIAGATSGSIAPLLIYGLTHATAYAGAKLWTDPIFLERINKVITAKNAKSAANNYNLLLKYPPVVQAIKNVPKADKDREPEDQKSMRLRKAINIKLKSNGTR